MDEIYLTMNYMFVALGGGVGAMMRYAISSLPHKGEFPIWTLIVNMIGAFMIGLISGMAVKKGWSDQTVLFLKTGMCGGFTTFSTFSLESYQLIQSQQVPLAVLYMILSVCFCLIGVFGGMYLSQKI